jgi:hypothetical protein
MNDVKAYLAGIGRRGGKVKGASKARGDSAYYAALVAKRKDRIKPLTTAPAPRSPGRG